MLLSLVLACQTTAMIPPDENPVQASDPTSVAAIRAGYKTTAYRLAASVQASPSVAGLCRMAIPGADHPYHLGNSTLETLTVYVNDAAWPSMQKTEGERSFAAGAVVVKEKPDGALGIMVKTADAGWWYAYVDEEGQVEEAQAKLTHCASCHEHGTIPETVSLGPVRLGEPRDAIFLGVVPATP